VSAERVLVLGAGGFLGRHLCTTLSAQGAEVIAVNRGARPVWAEGLSGLRWESADFADTARMAALTRGCGLVYHLVGGTSPALSNAAPTDDLVNTLLNTVAWLEAIHGGVGGDVGGEVGGCAGLRRLVFVSSGGTVYGVPNALPVAEEAPCEPICAYGIHKLAVEKYLALYRHLRGLDYGILRVANPFGEGQISRHQQGVVAAFLRAARQGRPLEIWGDGQVVRDYVYIGDVIDALLRAGRADTLASRLFNIGSGSGRSLLEVAEAIEAVVGRPLERRFLPCRPADVPAIVLDVSRARRDLGWCASTPWREALARSWAWSRDNL